MTPKQIYGEMSYSGTAFAITSPDFARRHQSNQPDGILSIQRYSKSFLGIDIKCLISREGMIVGWDAEAMENYNQAAGRI